MSSRNKNDVKKLFEFWCELAPTRGVDSVSHTFPAGVILESFPENFCDQKTLNDVPTFAFPCELESESVQSYSFVLTTDDSKWRFGFCRHDPKTQTAMVILTYLPWHDIFLRFLAVLAELRRSDGNDFRIFLSEAYNRGVPDLGGSLTLFYHGGQSHFIFERPRQFQLPSIPENHNLNLYYNFVDPKNMIAVFAAMLAERRIIFTSRRLDRLSSCIQAANAFLYPMVWQHIFIPVLPIKLKDYLSAPMPYLIGVPEPVLETMTPDELGEVVILNCDTKIFESPFDDVHTLPPEIVTQMKKQLSHSNEHVGDRVSKIFLSALVQLIGGYRDAVEFRDTGKTFNHDKFIETRPLHLRSFLAKMMELQIFQQFIDERLEMLNTGLGFSDEFELETVRYAEKLKKRRNYAFLKNVKDKTNPAVKSAVKSVKESSRGMKTAYKDLKSKFRDITPPNNTHFHFNLGSNSPQHPLDRPDGGNRLTGIAYARGKKGGAGPHSAPSSPVFSKRVGNDVGVAYCRPEEFLNGTKTTAAHSFRRGMQPIKTAATPSALAISCSSSHIPQSNGYAENSQDPTQHMGNHLAVSPTVSSASSLCSSEMNLSQELQNHPLFKIPPVDRSLKPSNSLELSARAHTLTAACNPPMRPPPPGKAFLNDAMLVSPAHLQASRPPASYYNHPYALHPHVDYKPPVEPRAPAAAAAAAAVPAVPAHHTLTTHKNHVPKPAKLIMSNQPQLQKQQQQQPQQQHQLTTTDSSYDNPPEIQSPPIPPRRQCSANAVAATAAAVCAGINRLERNCWQDYAADNTSLRCSSSSNNSSNSSCSTASFVTAASTFSHLNNSPLGAESASAPMPAPRVKKESVRSLQPHHLSPKNLSTTTTHSDADAAHSPEDTISDLISLDDSNNASFDLEDFDPLNHNARPLPPLSRAFAHNKISNNNSKKSKTLPAGSTPPVTNLITAPPPPPTSSSSVSNPLYPYYTPQHSVKPNMQRMVKPPPLPASLPPPMPPPDDDFELLRKYGLDQFTLSTTNSVAATTATATTTGKGMSNWMTFD